MKQRVQIAVFGLAAALAAWYFYALVTDADFFVPFGFARGEIPRL